MSGMYLLLGAIFLAGAAMLALYLLQCYAIYRMAKNRNLPCPGLAWIPCCREYLLGCLCDHACNFRTGRNWYFRAILPILAVLSPSVVPLLLMGLLSIPTPFDLFSSMGFYQLHSIIQLVSTVGTAFALYYLYADYAPGQETAYAVLSVVLASFAPPILLFILRERIPLSAGGHPPVTPRYQGPGTTGPGQYRQPPPQGWQAPPSSWTPPPPPPQTPPGPPENPPEERREGWYQPYQPYQQPYRTTPPSGREDTGPQYRIPDPPPPDRGPGGDNSPKGGNKK